MLKSSKFGVFALVTTIIPSIINMTKLSITTAERRALKRHTALGILIAIFFIFCFTARLVPISTTDRAIFVSVAEYLLSGNQLYTDVYDNKDPLFYYAVALQRVFGGVGEYLFELLLVIIAAVSAYDSFRILDHTDTVPKRILLIAVPLLVTGVFWLPGYTTLPGTALSLLASALFLRNKMRLAGGCIGLVAFTKLIAFPLPAIFCLTYEVILWNKQVSRDHLKQLVTGFAAVFAIVVILLLSRGELLGYLQAQQNNFLYSQGLLIDNSSFINSFVSRLRTVFLNSTRSKLLLFSLIASISFSSYMAMQSRLDKKTKAFFVSTLATCFLSILILGLTGLWSHHLSLIYFSGVLLLVCVATSLSSTRRIVGSLAGVVILASAVLLSGMPLYIQNPVEFIPKIVSLNQPSIELKAFRSVYPDGAEFARLGQNSHVIPHGATKDKLICPDFQQYPFYSPTRLRSILDCTKTASVLVVDSTFTHLDEAPEFWSKDAQEQILLKNWNDFVAAGETLLQSQYSCRNLENVRICSREQAK